MDTLVIGAGQAGLAIGYHLRRMPGEFVIVDSARSAGQAWQDRWDSLRLFSPASFNGLPGLPFPAPRDHYPSKDEMAAYLRRYAGEFALPLKLGERVIRLERTPEGFLATSSTGCHYTARQVVVATGAAMRPRIPEFANRLGLPWLHSHDYRRPAELPEGEILVVGAGNSGAELALDLAAAGRRVLLAGRDPGRFPFPIGGLRYRIMNRILSRSTPLGRRLARSFSGGGTPVVRVRPEDLAAAGVTRLPRVTDVQAGTPVLADGTHRNPDGVLFCTGYLPDYTWIDLPGVRRDQYPTEGTTPGLYFLGLPFQFGPASSLVGGLIPDSARLAEVLRRR